MKKVRRRKVEIRRRQEGTGDENNARRERRKEVGEERVKAGSRKEESYKYMLIHTLPNFTIFV
jgi:hypothetical protein